MTVTFPIHGSRVALLGTSLVQQNHFAGDRLIQSSARGWATWAEVLTHGQLDITVFYDPLVHPGWEPSGRAGVTRGFTGLNAGVSGQKARDIDNRIADVLALDFDLIIVDAGTNDMMVETKEVIQGLRERIVTRLLDAGKVVILLPILARGTEKWQAGGSERAKAHWINHKSRSFAARHPRCHVFDWNAPWVDWQSADGVPNPGFSDDGTHFSVPGAYAVGKELAKYLKGFLAPPTQLRCARDDRFDPIDNPLGNLVCHPIGSRPAVLADGSLPGEGTSAIRRICGCADRPGWQEVRFDSGACCVKLLYDDFVNPLPAGAWIRASCAVEVDACDGWRDISLLLQEQAPDGLTTQALAPFAFGDGSFAPFPQAAWSGILTTPPIKIKAPAQSLSLSLSLSKVASTDTGTIRFFWPDMRQAASPLRD